MLRNYLKIAFRRLWTDKTNAAINVLGLTLGITCCLVIYIFVRYESGFDGFHTNVSRIYRVVHHNKTADGVQHWPTTAYPLAEAIRQNIPGVGVTQTAGPDSRLISSVDSRGVVHRFDEKRVMFADANYLRTFDFVNVFPEGIWLAGNARTAFQQPNSVVLTQKMAERYFSGYTGRFEELLGKTLTLNNGDPLLVSGIIRNPPSTTNLLFDILVNYQFFKANNPYQATNWSGNYRGTTYVTLPAGADPKAFERQLQALQKKYMKVDDIRRISYFLQPITSIHTETLYGSSQGSYIVSRDMLWGLVSLAVFLILIASFNFINLTTAQAIRRRKEVGVRKVVGGTQVQLFSQFIGETLIIAIVAGVLSLLILHTLLNWINQSLTIIDLNLSADPTIWAFSAGLILVVALLAGFYPAIVLSNAQPITALKNTTPQRHARFSLRQGLIVLQFCITYALLVSTFVVSRQMNLFSSKDLGFTKDAVITINGPRNQVAGKLGTFREELLQSPAIKEVSFGSGAPITNNHYGTDFRLKSEAVQMNRQAEEKFVDLAYQSLFDLKLIAGRWFTQSNNLPEGSRFNAFVVNETMVKMLGLTPEQAIGKTMIINEGEAPILGVVKDFHNVSLQQAITPCVLMVWNTGFYDEIHLRVQTQNSRLLNLPQTLGFIEKNWKQLFPDDVYQYTFLNESLAKNYIIEQLVFDAFRIFAAISIFISCLGLFGLITFAANQRTKEIGVRKVLGASVASLVGLLSKDFLKLVLIAIVIASPLAWYAMSQWSQGFAYKADIEWWVFVLAGLLAVGIALLTVSFQSIKAALMNPVNSLRSE
ncbi:FtsX-like permease family protein [Spirosoma aureum]|uniref:FtsX-like permease family protein n=1 Tax=Spirosoma aureum TaxID=2692134 RepID=A0A6G9AKR3_9BACT|nr:ABC transporter permease [Spirosoma aureum]QIP12919.1 FtsX-like permease family protein [Spirosoma aureum]